MDSEKIIKEYYCVYCDKNFNDNKWTYDHFIPMNLGGPDKLRIICCNNCNQKLGFWMEDMEGVLLRSNYDFNEGAEKLEVYGKNRQKFFDYKEKKTMIFIPDKFTEQDEVNLSMLIYKIFLGACCFVYGKEFFGTKYHESLRKSIWDIKQSLRHSHSKSFCMRTKSGDSSEDETKEDIVKDSVFFDNKPNHTISLGGSGGSFGGIISLFGELEYAVIINDTTETKEFEPKFLIAKTTENDFSLLWSNEYEKAYRLKK